METTDIFKLIPHRYPFLLVDRIIDMDEDSSATGRDTFPVVLLCQRCFYSKALPRRQAPYACIILRLRSRR